MGTERKRRKLVRDILDVRSNLQIAGTTKVTSASPNIVRSTGANMIIVSGGGQVGITGSGYFSTPLTNVFQVIPAGSGAPSAGVTPEKYTWAPDYSNAGRFWIYQVLASGELYKAGTTNVSYVAFGN